MQSSRDRRELERRFPRVVIGPHVTIRHPERLVAGDGCSIDHGAYLNCAGGPWNDFRGAIRMGARCEIGPYCVLWGAGGITMGDNVHVGSLVAIAAHQARPIAEGSDELSVPLAMQFAEVVIEDHVLIGSGATITPGVRIGHHSYVGAGSTVVEDVPPYAVVGGSPARVIRYFDGAPLLRTTAG